MDVQDRLSRLEDAVIDLAIVVSQGHLANLDSANIAPNVVEAGKRLQGFYEAVINEREF